VVVLSLSFHASKKGSGTSSTSTRGDKEKIQIGVGNELHYNSDSEFKNYLTLTRVSLKGKRRDMPH